ncbi:MAG: DNA polymerase III subunit epsilon [Neisseriaceae bacterium]|nr:DNA polymerase III subunit epsilon [Neisseriaceae bacterium]
MRYIILDTETTGLSSKNGDRLVEFAGLVMENRQLTGESLHFQCNPERDVPIEASNIHGLTSEKLANKPIFAEKVDEMIAFLQGSTLIIHNAKFDVGFLNMELARLDKPPIAQICVDVIDTLPMAKALFPGKRASLDALCDRFGINRSNRVFHGALIDCELLAEVYVWMTRSQQNLAIEEIQALPTQNQAIKVSNKELTEHKIQYANAEELIAHACYVAELSSISKNGALWEKKS